MIKTNDIQNLIDAYEESIWAVDTDLRLIYFNSFFKKDFKKAFDIDLKPGMDLFAHLHKEIADFWRPRYLEALSGKRVSFTFEEHALRGKKYFRVNLNPITEGGTIKGVSGISVDITGEETARRKYEAEQRRAQLYLDIASVMFVAIDTNGRITMVNKKLCEVTGYEKGELIGNNWFNMMLPREQRKEVTAVSKKLLRGEIEPVEYHENSILTKDCTERIIAWHNTLVRDEEGMITGHLSSGSDVTEQRQLETQLKKMLTEKEYLLKEVHHRIKNNMATLISLINLQLDAAKGEEATTALLEIENRIRSMLDLYSTLFDSGDFENVSVAQYLSTLVDSIVNTFPEAEKIRVSKKFDTINLPVKAIFSIGIIINELVTNAMKYAFKDNPAGRLKVGAVLSENGIQLSVEDNGKGIPDTIDIFKSEGFGLKLIRLLVEQLQGTLELDGKAGTKITITMPAGQKK